jgi:phage-related protein
MATFPSIAPVYGMQKASKPSVRQIKFGDGYSQRVTVGLNQNPKSWSLTWQVSPTDAATIETFLDQRAADAASFTWTPPDTSTSYQWICYEWSKSVDSVRLVSIQATFDQVFEP